MLCDWETVNDFLEVLQRSTEYCSQGESLINQAATGVWYRARRVVANESSGDLRLVETRTNPAFVLPVNHASDGC